MFESTNQAISILTALLLVSHTAYSQDIATGIAFPDREPGKAITESKDGKMSLENDVIGAT